MMLRRQQALMVYHSIQINAEHDVLGSGAIDELLEVGWVLGRGDDATWESSIDIDIDAVG